MLMGGFKNPRHSFHEKLVRLRRRRRLDLRDRETVRKRGGHFHDIIDFAHALAALNTTHSLTELVVWRFTRSANRMNTLQWKRQGYTACGHRMAHRKWKETKHQPGTAGPDNKLGCCLVSFHFLWAILYPQAV